MRELVITINVEVPDLHDTEVDQFVQQICGKLTEDEGGVYYWVDDEPPYSVIEEYEPTFGFFKWSDKKLPKATLEKLIEAPL